MQKPWRLLAMAAVLYSTAGLAVAAAQTVMIRNGPPSARVEVALNGAPAGSGTTSDAGEATIPLDASTGIGLPGIDANIYVDYCDTLRRVQIVDRTKIVPPPAEGCDRHEISGIYWVRKVNTIVFDLSGPSPSLLLVRGAYVYKAPRSEDAPREWRPIPTGLLVFGGAGQGKLSNAFRNFCGTATPCTGTNSGLGTYTFGATYWIKRYIGIEGAYVKPRRVTAKGGDAFSFTTTQDTDIFVIAGKGGVPIGPVRIFGEGGLVFHDATANTTETIDVASQTFQIKTRGWSYMVGGGVEAWIWKKLAIYGDAGVLNVRGNAVNGGEAKMDDRLPFAFIGAKFRLTPK